MKYPTSDKLGFVLGRLGSCLIEVETDEGITGIGESCAAGYAEEASMAVKIFVERCYKPLLINQDPTNYRFLWDRLHSSSWYADTGIGMSALSGIDMALVDLAGKAWGVPACKVLGGCYRDKVMPYASHPWITPKSHEEACKEAAEAVERGFKAVKMSFSAFLNFGEHLEHDMTYVKEIRDAIGDDTGFMISDRQPPRPVSKAISMARRLEDFNLLFWEDPLPLGDIDGYEKLTTAVDLPIEVGEELPNQTIRNFILKGAVDAINPDVTQVGGLSEIKRIADLANTRGVKVYPHSFWSAVSAAANVQLAASMPDETMIEYRTSLPDPSIEKLFVEPLEFENGYIKVPTGPGLGIELDRSVVEELTLKE